MRYQSCTELAESVTTTKPAQGFTFKNEDFRIIVVKRVMEIMLIAWSDV
jgi:hypothetical protein